jgi:hypothetical protein
LCVQVLASAPECVTHYKARQYTNFNDIVVLMTYVPADGLAGRDLEDALSGLRIDTACNLPTNNVRRLIFRMIMRNWTGEGGSVRRALVSIQKEE